MTGLQDRYTARKWKWQESAKREVDQAEGLNRPSTDGGLEMQAIIILGSPEMGSSDKPGPGRVALGELREVTLIPPALQVIHPPDQAESRPDTARLAQAGGKKPLPPDRILLNSYPPPPRGLTPTMEEVTVPEPYDIKHILHRWKPFNRGESAADRLDDSYPRKLRMPITARFGGLGEEYSVVVPVGTRNEDLQQIVEDGMQIHNRNYIQSIELVK